MAQSDNNPTGNPTPSPHPSSSRHDRLLARLSPAARQLLILRTSAALPFQQPEPEPHSDFRQLESRLSPAAQARLREAAASTEKIEWPEGRTPRYLALECPDGEPPTVKMFTSAEALASRMRQQDDTDVYFIPVFGILLSYSVPPNRILFLPDDRAMQVTPAVAMVDVLETSINVQEDWFLGPPALSIITSMRDDEEAAAKEAAAERARKRGRPPEAPDAGEDAPTPAGSG